jgi:hypothetical protein
MIQVISKLIESEVLSRNDKKSQIILADTKRPYRFYIQSLLQRYNQNNPHLPNYLINKSGEIFMISEPNMYSNYIGDESVDKNSITIVLENLTWLKKIPIETNYLNWIGDIYKDKVFEKKWREQFFWDPYTQKQIESLVFLTHELCEKFNIDKKTTKTNVKLSGVENFNGVATKSNYNSNCRDINPSFNFNNFEKLLEEYEPV